MQWVIIGVIVIVILVAVGIYISSSSEQRLVQDRLGRYLDEDQKSKQAEKSKQGSAVSEWFNRRVEGSSVGDGIAKQLARADLKFRPGEFVALIVIVAVALGGFGIFLSRDIPIVSFVIGAVVGTVIPIAYLRSQQGRRLSKFNDQLPDMLNLMVNGLRAGYSTMQAMEAVSRELPAPINEEFRRVVQEMQLGVSMDKALDNLLRRIPSDDLDFVVTAVNVQREVGGPLADILDTITYTIRERIRIKGQIRVMTSQVRLSGLIITIMPFGLFGILWFINPDYMREFFNKPECGLSSLGVGLFMIGIGYFVMQKISDIEV